ncbi:MAG: hypothetical protein LBK06_06290 [Planctomycetaceae bacterium]|nr:hypothetical protein [Planctomycetaceae bacterium]
MVIEIIDILIALFLPAFQATGRSQCSRILQTISKFQKLNMTTATSRNGWFKDEAYRSYNLKQLVPAAHNLEHTNKQKISSPLLNERFALLQSAS